MDECFLEFCFYGGICDDIVAGYICWCLEVWGGYDCFVKFIGC